MELSHEELRRYGRHLILPEVGPDGQKRLKSSSVLLVGAGGLASPAALYLAAAGVGRLGIVEHDVVDPSNLQRQVLHTTHDVGRPKIESARERITAVNPNVKVESFPTRLTSENALEILDQFDVIVDGTDNFPTRYLINDACVLLKKVDVYGSVFRFEGQASVFATRGGPCYRCAYREPPPPELAPDCTDAGVLGILPGIIGTIQATEAIKQLLSLGETLAGRLLLLDALRMQFREIKLRRNPECPVCGDYPTIRKLIDYEEFCGVVQRALQTEELTITPADLKGRLDRGENIMLLDVREMHEREIVNIGGLHIPLSVLPDRANELDGSQEIVVYCHYGTRSARAVQLLRERGFTNARNLAGGVDAWAVEVDAKMVRY